MPPSLLCAGHSGIVWGQVTADVNMASSGADVVVSDFETWNVKDLREYLMRRDVPVGACHKETLVEHCYGAQKLGREKNYHITCHCGILNCVVVV